MSSLQVNAHFVHPAVSKQYQDSTFHGERRKTKRGESSSTILSVFARWSNKDVNGVKGATVQGSNL
jgi:hypothetical protein